MIGLRGSNEQAQTADAAAPAAPVRSASPKVKTAAASGERSSRPRRLPPAAPSNGGVMSGSQPIPPSSKNFDNRWSAFR